MGDLGALCQEANEAGLGDLKLQTCDLFDGRSYRCVYAAIVEAGLKDKKIEKSFWGLEDWLLKELDVCWKEAGSSGSFFPIVMGNVTPKAIPGLKPPATPANPAAREKPELADISSDFLKIVFADKSLTA